MIPISHSKKKTLGTLSLKPCKPFKKGLTLNFLMEKLAFFLNNNDIFSRKR